MSRKQLNSSLAHRGGHVLALRSLPTDLKPTFSVTVIFPDSWAQINTTPVQFSWLDLEVFLRERSQGGGGKDHGLCKHANLRTLLRGGAAVICYESTTSRVSRASRGRAGRAAARQALDKHAIQRAD